MVSTNTSDIDTVKNFLRTPENVDLSDLVNALGIMNVSLDGPRREQRIQTILAAVPLSAFFTLLENVNNMVTSSTCKVLEKLLQSMSYESISSLGLKEYLTIGLKHDYPEVRILALCQIEKCLESEESIHDLVKSPLFSAVLECLGFNDIPTSVRVSDFIVKIIQSQSGYSFLERSGVIKMLVDSLSQDEEDVVIVLIKCAVLKFFGKLSEIETVDFSEVENRYRLFSHIDAYFLSDHPDLKAIIPAALLSCIIVSPPIYLMILWASTTVLVANDFPTQEMSNISEQIYRKMGGNPTPLSTLITNAKTSLEELRTTCFATMQKIAIHPWGKIEMSNSKEFIDYIVNRTTEFSHRGKEWKFSIIQTLCSTPDAENLIAPKTLERLRQYLREGPFYVRTSGAVALESG
ncbi:11878_t:CDS:2 [Acaulospora colombiana]|uniref:11878_t:CDS:1 n=1 Tax=Acaulospora colombiana TaxID=27376 RepID=A0ACA9M342_9GLOM|nr:11878_t:CDS:2 [Acaulospora colombiana]